jgi:autotransporter-associated beta strand protein
MKTNSCTSHFLPNLVLTTALVLIAGSGSTARAADRFKADNTSNLNLPASWVGGVVPGAADVAVWNNTVTGPNTVALGANLTWAGIRITDPGGPVTVSSGSTLTNGSSGIDMTAATQNLTLNAGVTLGSGTPTSGHGYWQVASGRTLTLAAAPARLQGANNSTVGGLLTVGTTGTVVFGSGTVPLLIDGGNNPYVTYGLNDWAALSGGTVIPATYTAAISSLTAGVINDVQGSFSTGTAVDMSAIRFNDSTARTLTLTGTGTWTVRGILVTANSGGGAILGSSAFVRPNRVATAGATFSIFQHSAADFTIGCIIPNGSSSTPVSVAKGGAGKLILTGANAYTGQTFIHQGILQLGNGGTSGSIGSTQPVWNNGTLAFQRSDSFTFANLITGPGGVSQLGTGLTTLTAANTYTGPTVVHAGSLSVPTSHLGGGSFATGDGGDLRVRLVGVGTTLTASSATFGVTGASSFTMDHNSLGHLTTPGMLVSGSVTLNANVTVNIANGPTTAGTSVLFKYTGTRSGPGSFVPGSLPTLGGSFSVTLVDDTVNKEVRLEIVPLAADLAWNTGDGTWDTATANWLPVGGGSPTVYSEGDTVNFTDAAPGTSPITVTLDAARSPGGVTITNHTKDYVLNGAAIGGSGGLTKNGTGRATLLNNNSFSGPVTVNGGILQLGNGGTTGDIGTSSAVVHGQLLYHRSDSFTLANALSGSGTLAKLGAGTLSIATSPAHTGGTVIGDGGITLSTVGAGLSSGAVTLTNNALLTLYRGNTTDDGSTAVFASPVHIPAGGTGRIWNSPRGTFTGALTGGGTLNFRVNYVRGDVAANWSAFTGQINVTTRTGSDEFRVANGGATASGWPNARLHLGPGVLMHQVVNPPTGTGTQTIQPIGELAGVATATLGGNPVSGRFVNWQVGSLNTDAEFAGVIADGVGAARITKVGDGIWTLSGASTYTGETTITAGSLRVNGSLGNTPVTVNGGSLSGTGSLSGPVIVNAAGTLAPGAGGPGTLTINNNLTLGGTLALEVNKAGLTLTSDLVTGIATLTCGGAVTISATGDPLAAGDEFTVLSAATFSGAFTGITPAPGAGLAWDSNKLATEGKLLVHANPVANPDTAAAVHGTTNTIALAKLLANDTGESGETLTITAVTSPTPGGGTATLGVGGITYIAPTSGATDTISYTLSDGRGGTSTGTVNVILTSTNAPSLNVVAGPALVDNQFQVTFAGIPGYTYTIEDSTVSVTGPWSFLTNLTAGSNGLFQLIVTNDPPATLRFFRTTAP